MIGLFALYIAAIGMDTRFVYGVMKHSERDINSYETQYYACILNVQKACLRRLDVTALISLPGFR